MQIQSKIEFVKIILTKSVRNFLESFYQTGYKREIKKP